MKPGRQCQFSVLRAISGDVHLQHEREGPPGQLWVGVRRKGLRGSSLVPSSTALKDPSELRSLHMSTRTLRNSGSGCALAQRNPLSREESRYYPKQTSLLFFVACTSWTACPSHNPTQKTPLQV